MEKEKERRWGCWRVIKWFTVIVLIVFLVLGYVVFRAHPVVPVRQIAQAATGGLVLVTLDPSDPELIAFVESMADGKANLTGRSGRLARWMVRTALVPTFSIVSAYDPESESDGTGVAYVREREGLAGVAQFQRFAHLVHRAAKNSAPQAQGGRKITVEGEMVRFEAQGGEPERALTPTGVVVGTNDAAIRTAVAGLTSEAEAAAWPSGLHEQLFARCDRSLAQIRGYLVNSGARWQHLMEALRAAGELHPEVASVLSPEIVERMSEAVQAVYLEGELLGPNAVELSLTLLCADEEIAGWLAALLTDQLMERLPPELEEFHPKLAREGAEVTLTIRIADLKERLQGDADRPTSPGRRPRSEPAP